ncbi:hypothetical protein EG834_14845, partial [bacterium]|nr:hypothetical protein [bacterium]
LKDAEGHVTKGSTAKFILLALADHADEKGMGAYPGLTRMELKTGLTRKTIVNALDALKFNGIISLVGRSKFNTSNYTILIQTLKEKAEDGVTSTPPLVEPLHQDGVITTPPMVSPVHQDSVITTPPMVEPVHQDGVPTTPLLVKPLYLNPYLTTLKPSDDIYMAQSDFQKVLAELEQLRGAVTSETARLIDTWLGKHPVERIHQAIEVARDKRVRSVKYIDQVLITWEANGYPPTREEQVLARAFKPSMNKAAVRANNALTALLNYGKVLEANGE